MGQGAGFHPKKETKKEQTNITKKNDRIM